VPLRRSLLLFVVVAVTAGCGVPTPAAPPSAKEVLAKPRLSNLKDAHFNVTGKVTDNGATVELVGDGALVYKPKLAGRFKFTTNVGGQTVAILEISVDGTNYGMTPASPKWVATKSTSGIDPSAFAGTSDEKYVGEENLAQGKAWHATAKDKDGNAFDAYIRENDGYPIKYVETQAGGQNITLTFDKYNTGETITAPPADQVQQG
jgi:outer membrane lipoprotein-sorting protein